MAWDRILPPDTRSLNTPDPPGDHNEDVRALAEVRAKLGDLPDAAVGSLFKWDGSKLVEIPSGTYRKAVELPLQVPDFVDAGSGTDADPWTSTSGTGGLKEAITEASSDGRPVYARAGYYKFSSDVDNLFSGLSILTDGAQTVLVGPSGTGAVSIQVHGTSSNPIENVYIQSLHMLRSGVAGDYNLNISYEWARNCHLEPISGEGGGSSMIGIRAGVRDCQFDGGRGWGGVDRVVFQSGPTDDATAPRDCQFGKFMLRDGAEVIDFSGAINMQIDMVLGVNCTDEVLDMKSCSEFTVGMLAALGSRGAITTADEQEGMSIRDNVVQTVVAMDCTNTNGIISFAGGGATTGTREVGRNRIENFYCVTTETGAVGVRFATRGSAQLEPIATIGRFHVETPGNCFELANDQVGFTLAGPGYAKSSGARAFDNGASGSAPATNLTIDGGPMRFSAPTTDAINLGGPGVQGVVRLGNFWIEESGRHGIHGVNFEGGTSKRISISRFRISECAASGISAAMSEGELAHLSIRDGWIWNVTKSPVNASRDAAVSIQDTFDGAGTEFIGFEVDDLRIFDTQGTPTTVAYMFMSPRDYYTRRNNTVLQVASIFGTDHNSTEGANSVVGSGNLESTGP